MKFLPGLRVHAVDDEVIMSMCPVNMGRDQYLKSRESACGKLASDGVDFLWRGLFLRGE